MATTKDPEKKRQYNATYKAAHPQRHSQGAREAKRRYERAHPERKRQERSRAHANAVRKASFAVLRERVFALLGRTCAKCGFDDKRALQLDHINGGGSAHQRRRGTRRVYLDALKVHGEGFQILCANCNWIKRDEEGECARDRPMDCQAVDQLPLFG